MIKTDDEAEKARLKDAKEKMKELFENFKLDFASLLYYVIFTLRRMTMCATVIFLPSYGLFQISIYVVSAICMLLYAVMVKPYDN